ncbi:hypothetical protein ABGB07_30890 [Micromonosporaceae bacterium B7E4]
MIEVGAEHYSYGDELLRLRVEEILRRFDNGWVEVYGVAIPAVTVAGGMRSSTRHICGWPIERVAPRDVASVRPVPGAPTDPSAISVPVLRRPVAVLTGSAAAADQVP